jgi:hypothetical protein
MTLFCKDCQYSTKTLFFFTTSRARCMHPDAAVSQEIYRVTGYNLPENQYNCSVMRLPGNICGPVAKLFEQRKNKGK